MASRAETQERNRTAVLAAARDEFAERGFRDAKVDTIAQRVGLTRGAVYSNFPGKRALYFAVLADLAEQAYPATGAGSYADPGPDGGAYALRADEWGSGVGVRTAQTAKALGALALAWVRPLTDDDRPDRDLLPELLADDLRLPYTQLLRLDALLLGLALERLLPGPSRLVRQAEVVLGTLHGALQLAATAPGFLQPYDVVGACERLAGLPMADRWPEPPAGPPVRPVEEPWTPPVVTDLVSGRPFDPPDGVVAVLGLNRLAAAEEAVRRGVPTTVVMVTGSPQEFGPLARLVVAQLCGPLRQAFPAHAWPDVRVVCDDSGAFARAVGVPAVSDETETAVRVRDGRITVRADGFAACHAVAGA